MNNTTTVAALQPFSIPDAQATAMLSIARRIRVDKGEYFIQTAQTPRKFGLLLDGLFRYVYVTTSGQEYTKAIIPERNILSSYSAMLNQTPSHFGIQAMETSTVLSVDYRKWLVLRASDPFWDKFLIKALEKGYCAKEKRERELLLLDAEARYKIFIEEFPEMEDRIPLQVIASYLGIQPESLSRIRRKIFRA